MVNTHICCDEYQSLDERWASRAGHNPMGNDQSAQSLSRSVTKETDPTNELLAITLRSCSIPLT